VSHDYLRCDQTRVTYYVGSRTGCVPCLTVGISRPRKQDSSAVYSTQKHFHSFTPFCGEIKVGAIFHSHLRATNSQGVDFLAFLGIPSVQLVTAGMLPKFHSMYPRASRENSHSDSSYSV